MGSPDGVVASLRLLREALPDPTTDLVALVAGVAAAAGRAVPSYLGLTVTTTLVEARFSVLRTFLPELPRVPVTSVRLGPAPDHRYDVPVTVTLFAAVPGAFVDLAADLAYLFAVDLDDVSVDGELPGRDDAHDTRDAGPDGRGPPVDDDLAAMSVVNQAIGILIERGDDPAGAALRLRQSAAAGGLSLAAAARVVVASVRRP